MRKLLLASAALALSAGGASAANFGPQDPTVPGVGISPGVCCGPKQNPDPGKVIVRMDGSIWWDVAVVGTNIDYGQTGTANAGAKNQQYGMSGFMRLYFGIDGRMTNGMIYGASTEMRTNFPNQIANGQPNPPLGNASSNTTATTYYVRRAYIYFGGDNWGLVRLGQGDGPVGLFNQKAITTGEAFSTGGWDGDVPDFLGNAALAWPFLDTGNEYASNKITYMSPILGTGFQIGASFAPSSANLSAASGSNAASGSFDRQASSTLPSDFGRPRNIVEVGGQYQGPLYGAATVLAGVGYVGSGVVDNANSTGPLSLVPSQKGVQAFDAGLAISYLGFTPFGHIYTGQMNGSVAPQPEILVKGRSGKKGMAAVGGAMYNQGPWTVGASWYQFESEGSATALGNRMERGLAVGSQYNITKGVDAYLEYLYGTRYQRGNNFVDPAGPATLGNRTIARGIGLTLQVGW